MKHHFESISVGGSGVSFEEDPALRPQDWRELNHYLDAVRESAVKSNIKLPEHGLLLGLEQDAYTYSWTPDCQAQFDALVSVSGVPYRSPPAEVSEEVIHCDEGCCPEGIHVHDADSVQVAVDVEDPVWCSPTWGT